MATKLIAQTARGPKFVVVEDNGWAIEPFTWTLGDGPRRYGLAAINEAADLTDYVYGWGDVMWGGLIDDKGAEAWNLFAPLDLDVDAALAPDPAPAGFAECCEVLAATMGLLSITADGQQLWAVTNGGGNDDEEEAEDLDEAEGDEEAYIDEDA